MHKATGRGEGRDWAISLRAGFEVVWVARRIQEHASFRVLHGVGEDPPPGTKTLCQRRYDEAVKHGFQISAQIDLHSSEKKRGLYFGEWRSRLHPN